MTGVTAAGGRGDRAATRDFLAEAGADLLRPDARHMVADMAARDRRRTLPEPHHFSRRPGVPA